MSLLGTAKAHGSITLPGTLVVTVTALVLTATVIIVVLVF
ncbi:hypothetical protein SAMN05421770_101224 [Granulicella rosea]|uniref:Uncharacterized protein n=1 Tax=Granulicella rosea TaxID=474952 RepID=A0A239D252_9BACT|nr:hypothetical protein SAMN05421770_101224 [Granulicella rosea]